MTFEEWLDLKPTKFQEWWERYWEDTPSECGLKYWADYTDFLESYRAGQAEMRERAAELAGGDVGYEIADLPLEGDDD